MKRFLTHLQPIEKVALLGVVLGAVILISMGFVYPQVGVTVLFMLGVLSLFWSVLTIISAITRYFEFKKKAKEKHNDEIEHGLRSSD